MLDGKLITKLLLNKEKILFCEMARKNKTLKKLR